MKDSVALHSIRTRAQRALSLQYVGRRFGYEEGFLARKDLDGDLRMKVLKMKDELDGTIRIRARWNYAASGFRPLF
jgi:hypothetical protein